MNESLVRRSAAARALPLSSDVPAAQGPIQQSRRAWLPALPMPDGSAAVDPRQAAMYDYHGRAGCLYTVRQLALEYYGDAVDVGSRELEERWGFGKVPVGTEWRSAKARRLYSSEPTSSVTSLWSRNMAMYDDIDISSYLLCPTITFTFNRYRALDAAGPEGRNAEILRLQHIIDAEYPEKRPCAGHITFLSHHLKEQQEGFKERSERAAANRLKKRAAEDATEETPNAI